MMFIIHVTAALIDMLVIKYLNMYDELAAEESLT